MNGFRQTCRMVGAMGSAAALSASPMQFTSTVQLVVQEDSPRLVSRAEKVVTQQFADALSASPELHGKHYEVRLAGNEVVFYLLSNSDMRTPMQAAVAGMIEQLNGKVRARGRSLFYRTSWDSSNNDPFLDVGFNDCYTKVASIAARAVHLRDVLQLIKDKYRLDLEDQSPQCEEEKKKEPESISYLIPGECAGRMFDWNFGNDERRKTPPKELNEVMDEVAGLFRLTLDKKNLDRSRTYIFSGSCGEGHGRARQTAPNELLRGEWIPEVNSAMPTQVYFPLPPPIGN